jgi:protein CpxP
MKKVLIICGLLFSVMTFAKAQDGARKMATPEERAERNTTQLTKKLSLTEDQQVKVKAIFLDQATAMTKMREESKGDREAMMAKMKTANEESDAKINALLNDEQKKAFAAWQVERKENMKNRGARGAGQGAPADTKQ